MFLHAEQIRQTSPQGFRIAHLWVQTKAWNLRVCNISGPEDKFYLLPSCLLEWKNKNWAILPQILKGLPPETSARGVSQLSAEDERNLYEVCKISWAAKDEFEGVSQIFEKGISTDPYLLNVDSLLGKKIISSSGALGSVVDLVFQFPEAHLKYLLAKDASGRQVLIDMDWIESIDLAQNEIHIGLSRETVLLEASFNPSADEKKRYQIDV